MITTMTQSGSGRMVLVSAVSVKRRRGSLLHQLVAPALVGWRGGVVAAAAWAPAAALTHLTVRTGNLAVRNVTCFVPLCTLVVTGYLQFGLQHFQSGPQSTVPSPDDGYVLVLWVIRIDGMVRWLVGRAPQAVGHCFSAFPCLFSESACLAYLFAHWFSWL